jgi:hypothetical protein
MRHLIVSVCLALTAIPILTFPQTTDELVRKQERLSELMEDQAVLSYEIQAAKEAYDSVSQFCNVNLPRPALDMRLSYCPQKQAEFFGRTTTLGAQARLLSLNIDDVRRTPKK